MVAVSCREGEEASDGSSELVGAIITGETRGASIYFGGGFFTPLPDDPPASGAALPAPRAKAAVRTLQWQGKNPEPLCVMWGLAYQARAGVIGNKSLTGKQKLEAYIQHVVTHEVGHTLGLRHNFKGSLMPPTSSIMDYSILEAAISAPTPGPYDRAAIAYLYGKSTDLPTQPFATDEDTLTDPNAVRFDAPSPTPLVDYQIPQYTSFTSVLFAGQFPPSVAPLIVQFFGTEVVGYARRGTTAEATTAWKAVLDGARSPLASPASAAAADALSAAVRDARDAITATLNGLSPSDRALTEDLLARITAAISPYFE